MSNANNRREVLHIALGRNACNLSSHWMHLQGLAASTEDDSGFCDFNVTHSSSCSAGSRDSYYVPRALFIDQAPSTAPIPDQQVQQQTQSSSCFRLNGQPIEVLNVLGDPAQNVTSDVFNSFFEYTSTTPVAWDDRFRVKRQQPSLSSSAYESDGRKVIWDDDEEEEPEEDDDDFNPNKRRNLDHQDQHEMPESLQQQPQSASTANLSDASEFLHAEASEASWQEVLSLLPHRAKSSLYLPSSLLPIESSHVYPSIQHSSPNSENIGTVQYTNIPSVTYHQAAATSGFDNMVWNEWKEEYVFDNGLRRLLEDCDHCQGIVLVNDSVSLNHSLFAGLGTSILQELHDECPAAGKWAISLETDRQLQEESISKNAHFRQALIQSFVERGLALHHSVEYANAVLPLKITGDTCLSRAAVALEASTLPFRLKSSFPSSLESRPLIGLNSYYYANYDPGSAFPFGCAAHLDFSEFLKSLQSQSSCRLRCVWELDTMSLSCSSEKFDWWSRMREGTSLEQDQRMRQGVHRPQNVLPGSWMLASESNISKEKGLLTSLSPTGEDGDMDRSSHHHFALSASMRPNAFSLSTPEMPTRLTPNEQLATAMIQGMGIRYRPEQSIATVVPQTVSQVLKSTNGIVPLSLRPFVTGQDEQPVLSILGNTTRRHPHLQEAADEFKKALKLGTMARGYYNRQVGLGLLPEEDDCLEAVETCLDVRDAYEPPYGSGNDVMTFHDDL